MTIYRDGYPYVVYEGDFQPAENYHNGTKYAGWHAQSVSGDGTIALDGAYNVPPDALTFDGKCAQTVGVWGTNSIPNGDFSNGTTSWTGGSATVSVVSGELNAIVNAAGKYAAATINCVTDRKYYIAASIKSTSSLIKMDVAGVLGRLWHSGSGQWQRLSSVFTSTFTSNSQLRITDTRTSGWDTYYIDNVVMFDLTTIFGAGHEPTAAQIDAMLAAYPNSWFNGANLLTTNPAYTPNSPSPTYPSAITTVGNLAITATGGGLTDTASAATVLLCSLPDGTKDTYDAVTGVLTRNVGKYTGASGTSWTISDAQTNSPFICDKTAAGNLSGTTLTAPSTCAPTAYYKLATPTTEQLTPDLPVIRTGIKSLSVSGDVAPTIHATVKAMD